MTNKINPHGTTSTRIKPCPQSSQEQQNVNFLVHHCNGKLKFCAAVECPPNHAPKTERDEAQKGCVDNGGQFPRAQDKVTHTSCGNEQYYLCEREMTATTKTTSTASSAVPASGIPAEITSVSSTATSVINESQQREGRTDNVSPTDDKLAATMGTFSSVSEAPSSASIERLSFKNQLRLYQERIKFLNATDEISLQTAANVTFIFLNVLEVESVENKEINVLLVTKELETFAIEYGKAHVKNTSNYVSVVNQYYALHIHKVPANSKEKFTFPVANEAYYSEGQDNASISLPPGIFKGQERLAVSMLFNTDRWLPDKSFNELDGKPRGNSRTGSRIISIVMDPHPSGVLSENVTISFRYGKELNETDLAHCVFWNFSIRTAFNGSWSSKGCSMFSRTQTKIVCSCDHLTHFAVLMQVGENQLSARHKSALEIITYIGFGLSLVGESLTVITYLIFLNLKEEQIQIRLNLVIALAIAQIVFIAGINASHQKDACIFVASLIHYFYLAGFAWMLFEGIFLYLMIVKVYNTTVSMRIFYAVGWGVPLLVVTLSLVIAATNEIGMSSYIHSDFCWVNLKNNLIWTFAAPVLLVCLINIVIVSCVVHEIMKMQSATTAEGQKIRQGIKACAVLFPLLGLTWVFGILSVTRAGIAFQYIFTILNSLQGFFIFVLHVLRSSDVRTAFLRKKQQWKEAKSFTAASQSMRGSHWVSQSDTCTAERIASDETFQLNIRRNQVLPQVLDKVQPTTHNRNRTPVTMAPFQAATEIIEPTQS